MEQFRAVFLLVWYICVIENYLFTRAEKDYLHIPAGTEKTITCGDESVIRIDEAVVDGDTSSCESNECILNDDDFNSFEASCNGYKTCTVGFKKNIACVTEESNFNLSYSCLVPRNLLCTFEYSLCNWKNTPGTDLKWRKYSPKIPQTNLSHLPKTDHSTESQIGSYVYLVKRRGLTTAKLKSGQISFMKDKCLVLWYKMDSKSELIVNYRTSNISKIVNQGANGTASDWRFKQISLVKGTTAEIILQGTVGSGNNGYIAIDDIDIQEWSCNATAPISCNFEENWCGFDARPMYDGSWARRLAFADGDGRPQDDHTSGNGWYVFVQSLTVESNGNRLIVIEFKNMVEFRCLSFWYYMYHRSDSEYGKLVYTVEDETGNQLSSIIDTRKMMWRQFQANVYQAKKIILDYSFTPRTHGGIALDDIYISPIICAEGPSFRTCVDQNDDLNIECPDSDVGNKGTAFDSSNRMSCQTAIDHIYNKRQEIFRNCSDTAMCFYTPTELLDDKECFYMSKHLNLNYSCIEITGSFQSVSPSSTSVIGIVVGVVLSLIALSVLLIIAFIYFRRSRYTEKKGHSIVANENSHNDYTGHQNTAFSPEVNVTTQTDYCEIRTSKHNDQYHDITDTFSPSINTINDDEYSEIANVVNSTNNPNASTNYQHQYISLDPSATGFNRSNPQSNFNNETKINDTSNEKTIFAGGDDYAILDPDDLNESKNNTPKVLPLSENYVVLDPNETGFNRKNMDTVCNYELATPLNPKETSEDPYDVSKDETYDSSSNSRHKEKKNDIYSHMVDNEYDTAGNQRRKEDNDGTYDHFFGQKSEDDYDISKPL